MTMRVLVSGANGFIGSALIRALELRGDVVGRLVRGGTASGPLDVAWDPAGGSIDMAALAAGEFDAVAHFAGESLIGRWTDDKRDRIRRSRVDGTSLLAEAIAGLSNRPSTFACASAVGFYGDRGSKLLTESSSRGAGFLADVVEQWENAAQPAREAGIRTVNVRMGTVQGRGGGLIGNVLPLFKLGLGGPVGAGDQFVAWIGLGEAVRIWQFVLDCPEVEGALNAVGPTPCTNREHAKALGRVLGRPAIVRTPSLAVKLVFGQLGDELILSSQKVAPMRLEGLGFEFHQRVIEEALRAELGR